MIDKVKVHVLDDAGVLRITKVTYLGAEIPVTIANLEQTANDPLVLKLQINAARVEIVQYKEEIEDNLADEIEIEQPENDDF